MRPTALALLIASVTTLSPARATAQATDWRQIAKPPLRPFVPQQPRRVALPNGLVVFLQEDHELPVISGFARVRGGSRDEPGEKAGLVSVFGQVWRTGGTKTKTGDELDDRLEARAAKVETNGGLDSTSISFNCLKANFDDVFAVFAELLRSPEFRAEKIDLAKNQINTAISRRNDDPGGIASREARKLGYGAASPYARTTEYFTVAAVTRADLVAWHSTYFHPNNVVLGIVGDFEAKAMEAAIARAFGAWPKGPDAPKATGNFVDPKPGVYFVAKEDVNQSSIRMVHMGTLRSNPDYHAIEVMNEVFGGGFAARLFSNIRTKKGLAYSVGGGVGMGFEYPGLFQLSMATKSESTAAAIDALYTEIDNLGKNPATNDELQRAKDAILNSFIFRFDSKEKVLSERMLYEFYGYPADFLERYRAGIEKVTAADVARVARQYVRKDRIALLVVGKSADFDRPLDGFGRVTALDVSIPERPPASKAAAAGAADPAGRALLAKVAQGMGGLERIRGVKAVLQKATVRNKGLMGLVGLDTETLTAFPDRMRQQTKTPMGSVTLVVAPSGSFMVNPMGVNDMPSSQRENAQRELKTNPIAVLARADDPAVVARDAGVDKVGDVEVRVLELSVDGMEARWLVDPAAGRILRTVNRSGPSEQTVDFSDFRPVGGVLFAFKRAARRGGEDAGSVEVKDIVVNPPVEAGAFERPGAQKTQ